jgi:hypothetical protein
MGNRDLYLVYYDGICVIQSYDLVKCNFSDKDRFYLIACSLG